MFDTIFVPFKDLSDSKISVTSRIQKWSKQATVLMFDKTVNG